MRWKTLLKKTYEAWKDDKVPRLAGALAYYTALSLAPLCLVIVAVAGLVFGREAVSGELASQLRGLIGEKGGELVEMVLANTQEKQGIAASIIGFLVLLFSAGGVFGELQDGLNTIWHVKELPKRGLWGMLRERFVSFAMVLGVCFLLLVSLVISAGLSAFHGAVTEWGIIPGPVLQGINFIITLGVVTLLFALIFKYLPDVKVQWRDVWPGALVTAVLFSAGKWLIGLYIGKSSTVSMFGAASSLIVLLIWVYYTAQIFYFGAEFTRVYTESRRHVSKDSSAKRAEKKVGAGK